MSKFVSQTSTDCLHLHLTIASGFSSGIRDAMVDTDQNICKYTPPPGDSKHDESRYLMHDLSLPVSTRAAVRIQTRSFVCTLRFRRAQQSQVYAYRHLQIRLTLSGDRYTFLWIQVCRCSIARDDCGGARNFVGYVATTFTGTCL